MASRRFFQRVIGACLAALVMWLGILVQARAGEVIDHLPEVQLARGVAQFFQIQAFLDDVSGICDDLAFQEALPANLWLDDRGLIRSVDEVQRVLLHAVCSLQRVEPSDAFLSDASEAQLLLDVLSGRDVEVAEGVFIEGSKQPVRDAIAFPVAMALFFEMFFHDLFDEPGPFLGESPCETLRSFVATGPTIELQWAAFLAMMADLSFAFEEGTETICTPVVEGDEAALLDLAIHGDLDAALNLAFRWDAQLDSLLNVESVDTAAVAEKLTGFELLALKHYGEGFVGLALTIPMISLMVGQTAT